MFFEEPREEVDDLLFDFFINAYGLKRKIQSKGYQKKKPYSDIIDIIHVAEGDKAKASKMLTEYIEKKWIKGHASYGWTTFHKEPGYYGLWSFEAGALAKILELDDENLKDNNHYPYDLSHFKNGLTFEQALNQELEKSYEEEHYIGGIPKKTELESVVPQKYHQIVNGMIDDYENLSDKELSRAAAGA